MRASMLSSDRNRAMIRLYACVMIVTTGLAVIVALLATRADPQYSATAEIRVGPTIMPNGNYIDPSMPTEQRVATSGDVIGVATAQMGVTSQQPLQHLSVTVPVDTQILVMTYTADTPSAALSGANAFSQTYLQLRNRADDKKPVASLVSRPSLPTKMVAINYPVILGVAVLGGLLTGFGVAWTWDRVRGRIRSIADAERCTDLDALAVTPRLPGASADGDQLTLAGRSELDSLAARVVGQAQANARSTLLVTGAAPGCGSTEVAMLTALSLTRMGIAVMLVTADDEVCTRLSPNRVTPHAVEPSSVDGWPDARATEHERLLLFSLAGWDNRGDGVARLMNLLPDLHERLPESLIVIDGPPAWCNAGIALRADKILLVVALGNCSRSAAADAAQAFDHCAEKLMGLVITPERRHIREALVSTRTWISFRTERLIFRIRPASAGLRPVPTGCSDPGAVPVSSLWSTSTESREDGTGSADSSRNGASGHLPKRPPSPEPTGRVMM